jgi:hypothetical protein
MPFTNNQIGVYPSVNSVFGRTGAVTAQSGDYAFSLISGTAAVSQGGTGLTSSGAVGSILRSNGTTWLSSTASYSDTYAASSILYSNGPNAVSGLPTATNAILGTNNLGVPGFVGASPTQGQIIIATVTGVWTKSVTTYPEGNATTGTILRASGTGYVPSNWTIPSSFGVNNMVYASAPNILAAITPVNSAVMTSSLAGVPGWSSALTNGQIIVGSTGATPTAANITAGTNIAVTNGPGSITVGLTGTIAVSNGGTGLASSGAVGNVLTSNGTTWVSSAPARAVGYIWMNTDSWTGPTFAFTTAYRELRGLGTSYVLAAGAVNFSMPEEGRLTYTGTDTVDLKISSLVVLTNGSGSFATQLYKNGVPLAGSEIYVNTNASPCLLNFPAQSVVTNDYFSIFIRRSANNTVQVISISLSAST